MPKISIVVPIYNVEEYLDHCISSILAQTYGDYELILVDDGSTDGSYDLAKKRAQLDSRIQVIHQENGGLSAARNTGLRIAQGDYISFIDSDDFIEETMVEKCVIQLEKWDADLVVFDYYQYHVSTGEKEIISHPFIEGQVYSLSSNPELLVGFKNATWNKMVRRSLFVENEIIYPEGYLYEDLGTTYRLLARANKVVFVKEPLYDYLVDRPGNITRQWSSRVYDIFEMIQMNLEDYHQLGIDETYYEELKYLSWINLLECLKKTTKASKEEANAFIDHCFEFISMHWPEFPKGKYPTILQKNDAVYRNPTKLKLYLIYRRTLKKEG